MSSIIQDGDGGSSKDFNNHQTLCGQMGIAPNSIISQSIFFFEAPATIRKVLLYVYGDKFTIPLPLHDHGSVGTHTHQYHRQCSTPPPSSTCKNNSGCGGGGSHNHTAKGNIATDSVPKTLKLFINNFDITGFVGSFGIDGITEFSAKIDITSYINPNITENIITFSETGATGGLLSWVIYVI